MPKEGEIVREIKAYLQSEGFFVWKNHGNQYSLAGLPDLMAVKGGLLWAIEVKQPGEEEKGLTEIQAHRLEQLKESGAVTMVASSVDTVRGVVEMTQGGELLLQRLDQD